MGFSGAEAEQDWQLLALLEVYTMEEHSKQAGTGHLCLPRSHDFAAAAKRWGLRVIAAAAAIARRQSVAHSCSEAEAVRHRCQSHEVPVAYTQ